MALRYILVYLLLVSGPGLRTAAAQQVVSLRQALDLGLSNYATVKSREYNVSAAEASVQQSRREYLPNLVLSAQQDYGTINGQNGPLYGLGGFGVASSGLPTPEQNWNAAFGALYLVNVNWEVFTFGRARARIAVSEASLRVSEAELEQERFQHQVRVAASYFTVLAAQRLARVQEKNLERSLVFKRTVVARARNGLTAGVDSSMANADVSNARIALIKARDYEQEEARKLEVLIGVNGGGLVLDSTFATRVPRFRDTVTVGATHPTLDWWKSRVDLGIGQTKAARKGMYPTFSLFGVVQQRASGFRAEYIQDQTAFTRDYIEGITPTRTNYLLGFGVVWNATSIARVHAQTKALRYNVLSAEREMELAGEQLRAQARVADARSENALLIYEEALVQVRAASEAYHQKNTLYRNGLTTLVDVTQSLYALNRAEADREVAFINVWQALLLRAAASGDIQLLTQEL